MNKPNFSIKVTVNPWKQTFLSKQFEATAGGITGSFIFSIGLAFIPASLISYIVKEKSTNVKH